MEAKKLIEVKNVSITYMTKKESIPALKDVNLDIPERRFVSFIGPSGCGKTTLLKAIGNILEPTTGEIAVNGHSAQEAREKREFGIVFQDSVLLPWRTAFDNAKLLMEVTKNISAEDKQTILDVLKLVGLEGFEDAYPRELSGGMKQRAMIAMAICCHPALLIADEPTTALDVTLQLQILRLIHRLKVKFSMGILFISHDLGVVKEIADQISVIYAGKIVEKGSAHDIYENPMHPYTIGLMASVPQLDQDVKQKLVPIQGQPPNLAFVPEGCAFHPRCNYAIERCQKETPQLVSVGTNHEKACWVDVK